MTRLSRRSLPITRPIGAIGLLLASCVEPEPATTGPSDTSGTPGDGEPGDGDPSAGDGDPGDGDPTSGDGDPGDGDPTAGDGDPTTGDGDPEPSTTGLKWDLGEFDSPPAIEEIPPWLLTMNKVNANDPISLFHVDIDDGVAVPVCTLIDAQTQQPLTAAGPSLTFTRDDRLIASFGSSISEIILPECDVVFIGDIGYSGVNGIMPDEGNELYGISATSDVLLHIDTGTGLGVAVGPLGQNWGNNGGTWIEDTQDIIGLSGNDNGLYDIDQNSGMVALLAILQVNFGTVGIEYHPLTQQLYACTGDNNLYRIEDDYSITNVGPWASTTRAPTSARRGPRTWSCRRFEPAERGVESRRWPSICATVGFCSPARPEASGSTSPKPSHSAAPRCC